MDNEGHNWYDDIDAATLQRIKTYSAFCDYKSQNLMLQTLYEAMQKKIDEYKQTNRGIAKDYADLQKQVKELQQENAELKEKLKPENCLKLLAKEGYIKFTSDQLTEAKEIIEELYNIIPASMSDYAKEPMEHARKFMTEEADE